MARLKCTGHSHRLYRELIILSIQFIKLSQHARTIKLQNLNFQIWLVYLARLISVSTKSKLNQIYLDVCDFFGFLFHRVLLFYSVSTLTQPKKDEKPEI